MNTWVLLIGLLAAAVILYVYLYGHTGGHVNEGFQTLDAEHGYVFPSKLLVINMDKRKDRMNNFMNYYSRAGLEKSLPMERLPAVVGKEVDWRPLLDRKATEEMEEFLKTGKRRGHWSLTPGAVGCYLSHKKALEKIVETGQPMIICEDDALIPPNMEDIIHQAFKQVPYNENTLILFHIILGGWNKLKYTPTSVPDLYTVDQFWSTACYYATPTVAKTILANSDPIRMQIDAQISEMKQEGKLNVYAFNKVRSDISLGTDIQAPLHGASRP